MPTPSRVSAFFYQVSGKISGEACGAFAVFTAQCRVPSPYVSRVVDIVSVRFMLLVEVGEFHLRCICA